MNPATASADAYTRPVWRSFDRRFRSHAIAWVREGGLAWIRPAVRARPRTIELLLPCRDGALDERSAWVLLALECAHVDVPTAERGVARARVGTVWREKLDEWADRDAVWRRPRRRLLLDCRTCAACCRRNDVQLSSDDLDRFRDANRPELAAPPWVRRVRRAGRSLHVLATRADRCVHLHGNECRIYALRPDNCRWFPPASESCLEARASDFGEFDGGRP